MFIGQASVKLKCLVLFWPCYAGFRLRLQSEAAIRAPLIGASQPDGIACAANILLFKIPVVFLERFCFLSLHMEMGRNPAGS